MSLCCLPLSDTVISFRWVMVLIISYLTLSIGEQLQMPGIFA